MKDIESFFKDNLAGTAVEPPQSVWQKISQTPELVHFNKMRRLKRLAAYSFGGVAVAVVVATVLWLNLPTQDKSTAPQTEPQTTNNVLQPNNTPVENNSPAESAAVTRDNPKEADKPTTSTSVVPITAAPVNTAVAAPTNPAVSMPNTVVVAPKTDPAATNNNHAAPDKPAATANNTAQLPTKNSPTAPPEEEEQLPMEHYDLFMPNAFSPNGDGVNDRYELTVAFKIDNFNLYIYDRTGQLVFKSTDITHAWTGEMNGKMLPAGTYAYLVKYVDEFNRVHQKKGNILLIR